MTLTIEHLKKDATSIQKVESPPLPKGLGWFTKLMAKFGWHRQYEVIVLDKSKLMTPHWKRYGSEPNE